MNIPEQCQDKIAQLERQLADVTAERDSAVERFREEIKQRQETQRANAIIDAQILAAVTAERDELKADLCVFAVDMERQLSAVTAERDELEADRETELQRS